ncbi:hypothetical protein TSAR_004048 [Trichomalopsis sarcophagae]|uniref:Uncharacterized protein n=1 Tax=Trichomalopsis sarcophagae TaxID=543379 RepID=A0A232FMT0_9HYME|nr:hypothetical protein TSAR_004048 [Trichomalopsis sarcophagae]
MLKATFSYLERYLPLCSVYESFILGNLPPGEPRIPPMRDERPSGNDAMALAFALYRRVYALNYTCAKSIKVPSDKLFLLKYTIAVGLKGDRKLQQAQRSCPAEASSCKDLPFHVNKDRRIPSIPPDSPFQKYWLLSLLPSRKFILEARDCTSEQAQCGRPLAAAIARGDQRSVFLTELSCHTRNLVRMTLWDDQEMICGTKLFER